MPGFHRGNPLAGIIRGPARLLIEPVSSPFPTKLADILQVATTPAVSEVQTVTINGTPTGGTFTLIFQGNQSAAIAENAAAAAVQTALNAMGSVTNAGGVTVTGGPGPATPYVVTFTTPGFMPLLTSNYDGLTGGTSPTVTTVRTTPGQTQWDAVGAWTELGYTKTGVTIGRNNTEENIDVDQILAFIATIPNEWDQTVTTALADTTLENIQLAWEGGTVTTDVAQTPDERHLPIGAPDHYTQKRLAVVHQKTLGPGVGKVRAHVMRIVQRSPQNSNLVFNKAGEQQTIPHVFRALADPGIADPYARFGEIIEQADF